MSITVWVSGAQGQMGQASVQAVKKHSALQLVGESDKDDNLAELLAKHRPLVCIDFTHPTCAYANAEIIMNAGIHPVIGTTGFSEENIETLQAKAAKKLLGGVIAPNFSIGAVLMMRFASEAAKHFAHAEIIELHHERKADAPSGTAIRTAQLMKKGRGTLSAELLSTSEQSSNEQSTLPGARGAQVADIPIHSVRLPGHLAHQEVILGGVGETLRIRHDSITRECFMPGVTHAAQAVVEAKMLYYGLEHLL